jgi:hypothetical protein
MAPAEVEGHELMIAESDHRLADANAREPGFEIGVSTTRAGRTAWHAR